ncbi:hypothetical protein QYM36_008411, partial [Artemia franciscana]
MSQIKRPPSYLTLQMVRFFCKEMENVKPKIWKAIKLPIQQDVFDLCADELKLKLALMRKIFNDSEDKETLEAKNKRKTTKNEEEKKEKKTEPYSLPDDLASNSSDFLPSQAPLDVLLMLSLLPLLQCPSVFLFLRLMEKDIQLKSQPILDHLQSSSEMEPSSSKGDLDGLNDRHKKHNQLLEPKKYNFETEIQVLENLERSSTDMESLLTEVCSFNAFDAKLSIADSQIEAFKGKLLPIMESIQKLANQMTQNYFCFDEIMPSEVFRKIGDLESFFEKIRVKIEETESEARQGRAVRGEYWLGELKLDLVSVTKEVDTINRSVEVIRQKSKNEEYLENISVTLISLTDQIKTIKSWIEENKLQRWLSAPEKGKSTKKTWELINSCLNRSHRTSTPSEIKDAHGHIIERELEIANYMNLHFASIGQSVANKFQHNLPHGQCDYPTYLVKPPVKSMFLIP